VGSRLVGSLTMWPAAPAAAVAAAVAAALACGSLPFPMSLQVIGPTKGDRLVVVFFVGKR
jgi:hypothetical protein